MGSKISHIVHDDEYYINDSDSYEIQCMEEGIQFNEREKKSKKLSLTSFFSKMYKYANKEEYIDPVNNILLNPTINKRKVMYDDILIQINSEHDFKNPINWFGIAISCVIFDFTDILELSLRHHNEWYHNNYQDPASKACLLLYLAAMHGHTRSIQLIYNHNNSNMMFDWSVIINEIAAIAAVNGKINVLDWLTFMENSVGKINFVFVQRYMELENSWNIHDNKLKETVIGYINNKINNTPQINQMY